MSSMDKYSPNPAALVHHIRDSLLGENAREVCDVILHTNDGLQLPACRALLAIRSDYFKRLFFGSFSERVAKDVHVGINWRILREVVEFAYTSDSTLLQAILNFVRNSHVRRRASPDTCLMHISDLIALSMAADYCCIPELQRWCKETLKSLIRVVPKTACMVFERIHSQEVASDTISCGRLIKTMASAPTDCLLVPDVSERNPFKWRSNRLDESPQSSPEQAAEDFGVLQLSANALGALIPQLQASIGEGYSKVTHEYLFQVVYFWATNGRSVSMNDIDIDTAPETDIDRWDHAKALVRGLDVKSMFPVFVRDYLDGSGLVERETLLEAYRYHATKNCDNRAAKIAVEPNREGVIEVKYNPRVLRRKRKTRLFGDSDDNDGATRLMRIRRPRERRSIEPVLMPYGRRRGMLESSDALDLGFSD